MQRVDKFASKYFFLIPLLVLVVYANSLGNGFVLDDPSQVVFNNNVTSFNIGGIFFGSSFGVGGGTQGVYYKPLMSTAYAVLYNVFGSGAWSFHLLQVLLQAANSLLVFYIFRKFFKPGLAFWLALVFAVHPFNSEAVLYVSDLQDVLFFAFGALAFLLATRDQRLGTRNVVLVAVLMFFSLLSKESGVMFLGVIGLYRLLFCFEKKQREQFWWLAASLGLVFGLYMLLRYAAVGKPNYIDSPYPIMRLDLGQRLINVPEEVFYYIRNFFYPHDFAMAQHWVVTGVDWKRFYLPLLADIGFFVGVAVIGVAAWGARNYADSNADLRGKVKTRSHLAVSDPSKERPCFGGGFTVYLFFLGWFAAGLGLHLNIIPLDVTVADRWFYFPSVGLLGMMGVILSSLGGAQRRGNLFLRLLRFARNDKVLVFLGVLLIVLLATRTFARTFDWRNGLALDRRDIHFSRHSFPLENNYAFELIAVGKWDEALGHAKTSTEIGPWWWLNWSNLGVIYRHLGYVQKDPKLIDLSIKAFGQGATNTNSFFAPHENLAETILNFKEPEEAIAAIASTNKKMGLNARLLFLLALAQYKDGEMKAASESAAKAAQLGDEKGQLLYNGMVNGQKIQIAPTSY